MSFFEGLAEGFQTSRQNKQNQERLDKMAKLQGQLLELQIKQAEMEGQGMADRQDASNRLSEMLVGSTAEEPLQGSGTQLRRPNLEFSDIDSEGLGMLTPGMSLPDILANPEALNLAVRSGALDLDTALQEQRLSRGQQLAEDQFNIFSGMLDGADASQSGQLIPTGASIDPTGGLRLQFSQNPEFQTPIQEATESLDLEDLTSLVQGTSSALNTLEGSILTPGSTLSRGYREWLGRALNVGEIGERALGVLGLTRQQTLELVQAYDIAEKNFARIATAALEAATTDTARNAILAGQGSLDKVTGANAKIMADELKRQLAEDKIGDVPLSPELEAEVNSVIQMLENKAAEGRPDPSNPESTAQRGSGIRIISRRPAQ